MNKVKISILVISVILISVILVSVMMSLITSKDYSPFSIGPKHEQIPFISLMYRGLSYKGKAISTWRKFSWDFSEPQNYNYKYSAKIPETNIEVASFSYKENYKRSNKAFQDYETLLTESGYRRLDFHIVNQTGKFSILGSSAFENDYFLYVELIKTGDKYFIIILKSDIGEEEIVKKIL